MAILKGIGTGLKGTAGEWNYYQRNGQTIAVEKSHRKNSSRSLLQLIVRTRWTNLVHLWRLIPDGSTPTFSSRKLGQTDYNVFMSANLPYANVFLTKEQARSGGCVVAPVKMSEGKLPQIKVTESSGKNRTDIWLGAFTITPTTTIGEFSAAVIRNNSMRYQQGDHLVYYRMTQMVDATTGLPYVNIISDSITLDVTKTRLLSTIVDPTGFSSVDNYLGADSSVAGGEVWIHRRTINKSQIETSTQTLVVSNNILSQYTCRTALDAAIESYGGINKFSKNMSERELQAQINDIFDNVTNSENRVTITVTASPTDGGQVTGGGDFAIGSQVTIEAQSANGYMFTGWSDGVSNATRTITVSSAATFIALFAAANDDDAIGE